MDPSLADRLGLDPGDSSKPSDPLVFSESMGPYDVSIRGKFGDDLFGVYVGADLVKS